MGAIVFCEGQGGIFVTENNASLDQSQGFLRIRKKIDPMVNLDARRQWPSLAVAKKRSQPPERGLPIKNGRGKDVSTPSPATEGVTSRGSLRRGG